jgi:hypothetical protein
MTNCGYEAPEDPYVEVLLEQNIKGEQCAIGAYQPICQFTNLPLALSSALFWGVTFDNVRMES